MKPSRTPLRVLNYAVNGQGLGHLTRLLAINRQLRRLATLLDIPTEILFLTSSEADSLVYQHDFAAFKIPSKTAVAACGMDSNRYRKIAKQWVWNAVNLCSPDILIVDTFPAGSFHELYDVLDFGSKNVFIYRAVRPEAAMLPAFQSALRGYHLILMPQEGGENASPVPAEVSDRVVTTGEILIRSASEILEREEARDRLGIPEGALAVYASTGGGGDAAAEALLGASAGGLDADVVRAALSDADSPGRLEVLRGGPTVLVDAAHNPAGAAVLTDALREAFTFTRLIGVVGVLADKDAEGILGALEPVLDEVDHPLDLAARDRPR